MQIQRHSNVKDETLLLNIEEVAFMILKDKEKSKDKEKEKNRTDLDIEEVALMFPTGPLMLGQIVPRLDRPEERGDTVHLFYFHFVTVHFFDGRCALCIRHM